MTLIGPSAPPIPVMGLIDITFKQLLDSRAPCSLKPISDTPGKYAGISTRKIEDQPVRDTSTPRGGSLSRLFK